MGKCASKRTLHVQSKLSWSNLDLAEKCHKAEIKTSELRGDLHQSEIAREREKKRCTDIEETLSKSRLTRQLELREIWRLVQKEIETEGLDDPRDSPVSASTDCLKDHITKEIENLKDRLNKRQTALGVLKGKQLQLPLNRVHQDGGDTVCYQLQDSPNSPLVDALTIDFFNGNVVKSGIRPPTFSSFDAASLQRINCEACMKHVALSSNTSCPSLHQNIGGGEANRYVASTSNLNASRISHPNLNTSSSSSTSGVDVSPRRTRSIHGQIKRRSFIRHSSRYKNDDTSTRSDTEISNMQTYPHEIQPIERFVMDELNVDSPSAFRRSSYTLAIENQSAELNEDNLQPIARDRSLSFQAAIEHGQRSPDSAMELTQSCERSTSDTSDYQEYRYDSFIGQTSRNDGRTEGKSVSFDMGSEQDYEEEVENPAESLIRSNDSPHRKLSILREEEGENHSDQNGNINK
ncbi:hypothetical protein SNE40_020856 [Patella caerulea]|uniref:Uncharacterized protein n=1 Tax=Patella caerulea TaxID=87958 RepID=A0AAN8J525_PATCE